jgi:hypothetical protein
VEEYKTQFKISANRVYGLSETQKLSCFLGGLKDEIRLPIRMFMPLLDPHGDKIISADGSIYQITLQHNMTSTLFY